MGSSWTTVVIHVYAHLVGREIADVTHGGFDGVVFTEQVPRVRALAGLSTMINVLMLFSPQVVDGSPRLCDKGKARATNNTLHSRSLNSIITFGASFTD
jgi:hypothetical protein